MKNQISFEDQNGLVCYWDFGATDPYVSKGKYAYRLTEGNGAMALLKENTTGVSSVNIQQGQYLYIRRQDCPALNICGPEAEVTVLAWIKRRPKSYVQCEAIAGMWNETERLRQYCLFLNLRLHDSADQVCGHISGVGGPTPGQKWCIDASIGQTPVPYEEWQCVAFTYNGKEITSYLNGVADLRLETNPYDYTQGIFNPGVNGSDFTVGAVHRLGEMGNFFVGQVAILAVYNKALSADELLNLFERTK